MVEQRMTRRPLPNCSIVSLSNSTVNGFLSTNSAEPVYSAASDESSGKAPLVGILVASTSRAVASPSIEHLSVFTILIPSLMHSVDCGFRYLIVLGNAICTHIQFYIHR